MPRPRSKIGPKTFPTERRRSCSMRPAGCAAAVSGDSGPFPEIRACFQRFAPVSRDSGCFQRFRGCFPRFSGCFPRFGGRLQRFSGCFPRFSACFQRLSSCLQRFGGCFQRFSGGSQRFGGCLQRSSDRLQRFSDRLQRFSQCVPRFGGGLQRFQRSALETRTWNQKSGCGTRELNSAPSTNGSPQAGFKLVHRLSARDPGNNGESPHLG
jgi:hypothetical protein